MFYFIQVSTCYGGAPIVMTPPHFLQSDESLIAQLDGISPPNKGDHETYLDLEPLTGAAMAAHKRIQVFSFLNLVHYYKLSF